MSDESTNGHGLSPWQQAVEAAVDRHDLAIRQQKLLSARLQSQLKIVGRKIDLAKATLEDLASEVKILGSLAALEDD